MKIILGSSSPYRQQLLRELGYSFEVLSPGIDEQAIRAEDPAALTLALAEAKGDAVAARVREPALILSADQVVTHGGAIREKPRSEAEARHFLRTASQAPLETVSAVAVTHVPTGSRAAGVEVVRIHLAPIPEAVIERLVREGEVLHCAGALRLEDPLLAPYLRGLSGMLDSVMGLPKELTRRLIHEVEARIA